MSETTIQAAQAANDVTAGAGTPDASIAAPVGHSSAHWAGIPSALRDLPQWCVAGSNKAPRSPRVGLPPASVNDPASWGTYIEAATLARQHGLHIGFILSEADGLACIDLDVKPDTTPEELSRVGAG